MHCAWNIFLIIVWRVCSVCITVNQDFFNILLMTHCLTSPLIVTSRSQLISSLLLSEPSNCPGSDERERRGSRIFSSVLSPPPSPPSLSLSTRHLCSVHTYQGVGDWNDEMFLFLLFWCDKIKIKNAQLPISGDYDAALAVLLTSNVRGFTVPKEIDFPNITWNVAGKMWYYSM